MSGEGLLREGATCWQVRPANRVAFLIDGEAFFGAVADALENARHSVWLLGWDFHSGVRLRREGPDGRPVELVALLESLVRERPALRVRVLGWDFAMLYTLEREFLPLLQFGAKTHRRIRFRMDSAHPLTASQHQKLVVVDDALAFAGGFDLTSHRWDTRAHLPDDPRRRTPSGKPYQPFHDVQIAVDGEAAASLAELARERWRRAGGERIEPRAGAGDPWPEGLVPAVRDVQVGIARTLPSYQGEPEVREVEALYREAIAAARRFIYLENQYLTAGPIAEWLAARLGEPAGPEVVIVGPRRNSGWLEQHTMGVLRDRVLRHLGEADVHGRLRVLYPHVPGLAEDAIVNIHSKVMVGDDDFARVGSANLSSRSLGLDTECDLAFEANGRASVRKAIAGFRNDLLAEHLGTTPARVAEALERSGSLVAAVDALGGGERTLRPLEPEASDLAAEAVGALGAVDPEHPAALEELLERFDPEGPSGGSGWALLRVALVVAVLAVLAAAWQWTSLGEWVTPERLGAQLARFRESWHGPLSALAVFTLASTLLVPVTALTVAAGLALGPGLGIAVAWTGCTASAVLGYAAGRLLWRDAVRRLAGDRLNRLSRRLARRGVLSTVAVRVFPVAPFAVVNLVAGASHVRTRDFVLGTVLGMFPGTVVLVLAADGVKALFLGGTSSPWLWLGLAATALVGVLAAARVLPRPRASDARSG